MRPKIGTIEKWLVFAALGATAAMAVVASFYSSATPELAAVRAVRKAVGPEAHSIRVAGRYRFEDVDGSTPFNVQIACGSLVLRDETRPFAVLVSSGSGRSVTFVADEVAIHPGSNRALLSREAELLGACDG